MTKDTIHIEPVAYRVGEFCQKYVISRATFYRQVQAGQIRPFKRGSTTLVARTEAERWFANLQKPSHERGLPPGGSPAP